MTTECPRCLSDTDRFWCNECVRHAESDLRAILCSARHTVESRKSEITSLFDRLYISPNLHDDGGTVELERSISLHRRHIKALVSSVCALRERVVTRRNLLNSIRYAGRAPYNSLIHFLIGKRMMHVGRKWNLNRTC